MITVKLHSVQRILLEVVLYTKDTIGSNGIAVYHTEEQRMRSVISE